MNTITLEQAKEPLGERIEKAAHGKPFIIMEHGDRKFALPVDLLSEGKEVEQEFLAHDPKRSL